MVVDSLDDGTDYACILTIREETRNVLSWESFDLYTSLCQRTPIT